MATQIAKNETLALDTLRKALSTQMPVSKVNEIFHHYDTLMMSLRLGDCEKCLLHAGKFVEAVLKCLHFRRTGVEVDSVKVEEEIKLLVDATSLDTSERMTIPRFLRSIYDLRSKRGGGHNNSFDPNEMDSALVVAAAKWVLEELTRLYLTNDSDAACRIVANLMVKDIPLVEEIDGESIVLRSGLSARVQLEILLLRHYPKRCAIKDLAIWVKHNHSEKNVRVTLSNMKTKALVHENENGWVLTVLGVQEAQAEIAKLQNGSNAIPQKSRVTRRKGVVRGRK